MTDRALPAPEAVPATSTGNDAAVVTLPGPGFRFNPSDEELIRYYLTKKVKAQSIPMSFDVIAEVDVYKHEPSELPEHSRLKTKDQEWFFLCPLEKKSRTSSRINRATKKGHWKKTGEDRKIQSKGELIGVSKSLVYHSGRAPNGRRTNWVMHEYSLVENKDNLEVDAYVLYKLFRKQNALGPSGCIYAPFLEQDWDDDVDDGIAPVPSVVHANRINDIQQETHSQNKNFIDLNEPPREFEIDDDPKTVDQDDNDEPLTQALCVLNKDARFPLIQYKRKRKIDSYNNSSQTTQDHCSLPETTSDTISSDTATLEVSEPEPVATMVPTSSSTELINDMEKEMQQMAVEGMTYELEMKKAEMTISFLEGQINKLRAENEELKKNNRNK